MIRQFIILATLALYASVGQSSPTPKDYFSELLQMWRQSTSLPETASFDGWYSGRCYRADNPQFPFGAVTVAANRTIEIGDPNNGPLFPPESKQVHVYQVLGLGPQGTGAAADYFDQLDSQKENLIHEMTHRTRFFESKLTAESLEGYHPQGNLVFKTKTSIQNNQQYYLVRITFAQTRYPMVAGQNFAMCYFFKKIK